MTTNYSSQSREISDSWVRIAYDGGSEDLGIERVSQMFYKCYCST